MLLPKQIVWTCGRSCTAHPEARVYQDAQQGSDHRRFPRLDCGGIADVRVLPNGSKETGSLVNLSKRGCCFLADDALRGSAGSSIEVHFKVRGLDLRVGGVIRHVHQYRRAGIEFVGLNDRKREQLDEIITELSELSKAADASRTAARQMHQKEYFPDAG